MKLRRINTIIDPSTPIQIWVDNIKVYEGFPRDIRYNFTKDKWNEILDKELISFEKDYDPQILKLKTKEK